MTTAMLNTKITVVIPTRERCSVLQSALRTVSDQDIDNLEIIVSDNCSRDHTREIVAANGDTRIRYLNTKKRLSMSHNWEFALSHVDDGWVTFIGDDDGLMPGSLDTVRSILKTTQEKVVRSNSCSFEWPGIPGAPTGRLVVPLTSGSEFRKSNLWLKKALQGKARYDQLPMIYDGGFIHVSVLRQIKSRLGSFFSSANPDIWTAIAIAMVVDKYMYVHEPLAIRGTSSFSNGHSAFSAHPQRNQEHYKKFLDEENIPFHPDVPTMPDGKFPLSLQACVYEAYLQAAPLKNPIKGVNHAQQLPVILATSGKHRKAVEAWGEIFAKAHDVDFSDAQRLAARKRIALQSRVISKKLSGALKSIIVERLPVRNIHEASIAAATIMSSPGRLDTMRFLANQVISLFKREKS